MSPISPAFSPALRPDAVAMVDAEVRAAVRQHGLDPVSDPEAVRRVIADVVHSYSERSLTTSLPATGDHAQLSRTVFDRVAGYGPLQQYFDDPAVEEIWINAPAKVFVAREGISELTNTVLSDIEVRDLVERMLRSSGRRLDVSSPFVDALLPDGSRLHVVIPDITRTHWAVNIRKFVVAARHLDDLVALGTLTEQSAAFLEACVVAGLNIVVAGGTQAGKTTLLNALASSVPARERVVTVEEVFELQIGLPDIVSMQTRQAGLEGFGEINLRHLVREALRMRPSRMIVGEVRQQEALDLLIALNSGLPGMATVHANSAREAVTKLCVLPLLAAENISASFVVPTVAGCVDIVVHTGMDADGRRRVREIAAIPGRVENDIVEIESIFARRGNRLVRTDGYPPHADRFERAGYDLAELLGQL